MHVFFWFESQKIMVNQSLQQDQGMKSNYDSVKNSKQESLNNNFQIPKRMLENTAQQILDDWMLWISEYSIFMFFWQQNMKIILKFIG